MNKRNRSKYLFYFAFLCLLGIHTVSAQENDAILNSYKRNFVKSNLASKAGILRDAATDEKASEFMGHLYEFALNFVLQYEAILQEDPDMINLAVTASRGLGGTSYAAGTDILWEIFLQCRDTVTKVEALRSLSLLGKENLIVVKNINQFLADQTSLYTSGTLIDYPVLSAAISALGELANSESFSVLFSAMIADYPANIKAETENALSLLEGDYKAFILTVIKNNPPNEKLAAFRAALNTKKFTDDDLGDLAEASLAITLEPLSYNAEGESILTELRYASVRELTGLKWMKALDLAIKNFYRVQEEYNTGKTEKARMIEAIQFLGVMENPTAAQNLALYLGLLNSQMERSGRFDEDITMALIQVLGGMGDKISFDYLLYISYLAYPEIIQNAAKEALDKLKW